MKTVKRHFKIQDKMMGLKYTVIAQDKTHFLAVDKFGDQVLVNKTQAFKI